MTQREIIETTDRTQVGVYARFPVAFVRGEGARLWDADGKEYLDCFAGLAVSNLGHAHPGLIAAISEQAGRLLHASNFYYTEPAARLGDLLTRHSFADRVFFSNSGAEANEAAIKLARKHGADRKNGRYEILTAFGSFHGRTLATLSATAQEKLHTGFQPLPTGFRYVPFGDASALPDAIHEETVAILVEPIQGEGGVNVPPAGYLGALRKLCDDRDLLLILDEVQVGMGRTGELFAHEHEGIRPDIMTLAKALGGGVPIGAMLATEEVAGSLTPGSHGSTFGGNPLACAAGTAVFAALLDDGVLANAKARGEQLRAGLESVASRTGRIREVRGRGLILGAVLDRPGQDLVVAALERGLLLNCTAEEVIRWIPPLVIHEDEIDRALGIFEELVTS